MPRRIVPALGQLASGVWHPTAYGTPPVFPANAPSGPYAASLSALNGANPNGTWSLYVFDDGGGDSGAISNGWSLALSMISPVNLLADLSVSGRATPYPVIAGNALTYTFSITNNGPAAATSVAFTNSVPAGVTFISAAASQGSVSTSAGSVVASLGTVNTGLVATVTMVVLPTSTVLGPGTNAVTLTSSAVVAATETDINLVNNSASVTAEIDRPIADVGVSLAAAPNPVYAELSLTNTIVVTNNGPQTALNVVLTSPLPTNTTLVSVSSTVGTNMLIGNNVTCLLGDIAPNGKAAVSLVLIPWSPSITNYFYTNASPTTNVSTAYTNAEPPWYIQGTNIVNSTLTNYIYANTGPNISTVKTNATPPWYLQATNIIDLTNMVYVTTYSQDRNSTNDTATTNVNVLKAAPEIIGAGALLTYESGPVNGGIDPGETVRLSLALANIGARDTTTNLTAVLELTGAVATNQPADAVLTNTYGRLIHGGPSTDRAFTFKAADALGEATSATLKLQDGTNLLARDTVTFTFFPPMTKTFSTNVAITIPDHGIGLPYPSSIIVSGVTGQVSKATVTLNGLTHTFPHDISVLLVSPSWDAVLLMSHTGGGHAVNNLTLNFADASTNSLPSSDPLSNLTYKPTSYPGPVAFPAPAPSGSYGATLSALNGGHVDGLWSLYVLDDTPDDGGLIGGWSLDLTFLVPVNPVADLAIGLASTPSSLFVGATLTNTIWVTNLGPAKATGVVVTNRLSSGEQVAANLGSLASGASAMVTLPIAPAKAGNINNTASVVGNEVDPNVANNSASTTTSVVGPIGAQLSGSVSNGEFHLVVTAQPDFTYVIEGSTNLGVWQALSTNMASPGGTIKYTDTAAPGLKQRFYRTRQLAP